MNIVKTIDHPKEQLAPNTSTIEHKETLAELEPDEIVRFKFASGHEVVIDGQTGGVYLYRLQTDEPTFTLRLQDELKLRTVAEFHVSITEASHELKSVEIIP